MKKEEKQRKKEEEASVRSILVRELNTVTQQGAV